MLDVAEVVGDPVLTSVADEVDADVAELGVAVRAAERPGRLRRLGAGAPVRALDDPGDHVLEPAEHGATLPGGLVRAEAVTRLDGVTAPITSIGSHRG